MPALNILSWNLGGYHIDLSAVTAAAIKQRVVSHRIHICLFQEVTREGRALLFNVLKSHLPFIFGNNQKRSVTSYIFSSHPISDGDSTFFDYTERRRQLVTATVTIGTLKVNIMTAHLESGAIGSRARMLQVEEVLELMQSHTVSIFAGDTNLRKRESEMTAAQMRKRDVIDAFRCKAGIWTTKNEATWDTLTNSHARKRITTRFKPRMRLDQAWLHGIKPESVRKFYITGTKALQTGEHCSDHYGIVVRLKL
eukprot:m.2701 g.2701  ORF g.2701 m.2701 type:complete len:253 (+) comp3846_c0_seq1:136-894(+)